MDVFSILIFVGSNFGRGVWCLCLGLLFRPRDEAWSLGLLPIPSGRAARWEQRRQARGMGGSGVSMGYQQIC